VEGVGKDLRSLDDDDDDDDDGDEGSIFDLKNVNHLLQKIAEL